MVRYYSDEPNLSPFLTALNDVRNKATREGWRYQHVHAIIVAIDQYAEAATGNREYFLNKPVSIGGSRKAGDVQKEILWRQKIRITLSR
jgi:hypothetical protein